MLIPAEHKTVQSRILRYVQETGWCYVPRAEAEARQGFDPDGVTPVDRVWTKCADGGGYPKWVASNPVWE